MFRTFNVIRSSLIILLLLQLQACASSESIEIQNARVRTPTSVTQALGGFMVLKNNTENPITLVDAKSDNFKQVMLHETINKDGMHTMEHGERIKIPAKGQVVFKHGSYHIMFMGLLKTFKSGDKFQVTLVFADGQERIVSFVVKDSV